MGQRFIVSNAKSHKDNDRMENHGVVWREHPGSSTNVARSGQTLLVSEKTQYERWWDNDQIKSFT